MSRTSDARDAKTDAPSSSSPFKSRTWVGRAAKALYVWFLANAPSQKYTQHQLYSQYQRKLQLSYTLLGGVRYVFLAPLLFLWAVWLS